MIITNKSQIGKEIKKARGKLGKQKLATKLSISKITITEVEENEVDYRVGTLLKILKELKLTMDIKPEN